MGDATKSFTEQDKPMDFHRTGYENLISIVSDFSLQQTFKKLPLVEFLGSIQKNIHNYL